jgi:hypothetical protein
LATRLAALGVLLSLGCAAALKEPPPVSALQREAVGSTPADALLQEAAEEYAKRPSVAAVQRAEGLCLQAAQVDESGTAGLVCAMQTKAWLAEREKGVKDRTELSVSAVQVGQWCLRRDPASAPCKYWLAVSLGLQARDRPVTAEDGLKRMVQLLRDVAREAPLLDEAGPERVLALLLVRAPGWPVGPGDAEEAIPHARKAVDLRPEYPPNQVALGEVLIINGDKPGGQAALRRAIDLAGTDPWSKDPDAPSWIADARALLPR